ncbi:multidrug effflux MFS transporter [Catellatospora bangladeshensis]|uniref:multidrug effflux MFS transporter n=1 Tax=Catellatospora bangladeshensis TaxID=310355 RepID=UPI00361D024B
MTSTLDAAPAMDTAPAMPGDLMTGAQRLRLVLVLGSLIAIGPLTIDMYLPALPAITDAMHTTSTAVQLTLTGTLAGLGLGQLVIGPLSDAYGRRRPLIYGLVLHVVASALCVVAPDVATLGVLRVLQGLGVAASSVVAMAVVRDLFDGSAFAKLFSRLMLVMGAAPVLAPTLGGALLRWTQWQGVFVALAGFGIALTLVATFFLRETLPVSRRQSGGAAGTLRMYRTLLRDRTFVGLVLVAGLAMAALFAYVAGSSFVMQGQYGLDEQQFAIAFGAGAAGLIGATQLNVRLLRRYPRSESCSARWPGAPSPGSRWCCSPRPGPAACPRCSRGCGRCSPRAAWRCRTRPRWPCPATARRPGRRRRCWARCSSASGPSRRRWSACSARTRSR